MVSLPFASWTECWMKTFAQCNTLGFAQKIWLWRIYFTKFTQTCKYSKIAFKRAYEFALFKCSSIYVHNLDGIEIQSQLPYTFMLHYWKCGKKKRFCMSFIWLSFGYYHLIFCANTLWVDNDLRQYLHNV